MPSVVASRRRQLDKVRTGRGVEIGSFSRRSHESSKNRAPLHMYAARSAAQLSAESKANKLEMVSKYRTSICVISTIDDGIRTAISMPAWMRGVSGEAKE